MRAVKRGNAAAPAGLSKVDKNGETEIKRVRDYINKVPGVLPAKAFSFEAYKSSDVKERLAILFYRKCAYCESTYDYQSPVDVEHFRPKGNIEGNPTHPGYWWLAAEWTNLLPSCIDCNRRRKQKTPQISASLYVLYKHFKSGKKDSFPVVGAHALPESTDFTAEGALLLDPTRDDPDKHLVFCVDANDMAGLVYPANNSTGKLNAPLISDDPKLIASHASSHAMSEKGAVSIQCYGLNRLGLVQQRAKVVQQLRFLESILIDVAAVCDKIEIINDQINQPELTNAVSKLKSLRNRIVAEMRRYAEPAAPYSAIAKEYLKGFAARVI